MPPLAALLSGLVLSLTYSPPEVVGEAWTQAAGKDSGACAAQLILGREGDIQSVMHSDCPVSPERLQGVLGLWWWESPGAARVELTWSSEDLTIHTPQVLRSAWREGPPMGDVPWRKRSVAKAPADATPGMCWIRVVVDERGRASVLAFDACAEPLRPAVKRAVRKWRAERRGEVVQAQVQIPVAR